MRRHPYDYSRFAIGLLTSPYYNESVQFGRTNLLVGKILITIVHIGSQKDHSTKEKQSCLHSTNAMSKSFVRFKMLDGQSPIHLQLFPNDAFLLTLRHSAMRMEIIVVEVKCFANNELIELYTAVGQYMFYRNLMAQFGINRPLYLAIPSTAYNDIIRQLGMPLITETKIKLIVVDLDREVIEKWLE